MRFYLGTHVPNWLGRTDVPLFVSYRRLAGRRSLPRALGPWAMDSGGFSELLRCPPTCGPARHDRHGWQTSAEEYAFGVRRISRLVGGLVWAAPQDWMVEPTMRQLTGLSVEEHQERTVANFVRLRRLAPDLPFMPVLQGWTPRQYLRCAEVYRSAGVRLDGYPVIGVGSVCRRQHTAEVVAVFAALSRLGVPLHGFGVKRLGVERAGHLLASADSMAWSFAARRQRLRLAECSHRGPCNNCLRFALQWREAVIGGLNQTARQAW